MILSKKNLKITQELLDLKKSPQFSAMYQYTPQRCLLVFVANFDPSLLILIFINKEMNEINIINMITIEIIFNLKKKKVIFNFFITF